MKIIRNSIMQIIALAENGCQGLCKHGLKNKSEEAWPCITVQPNPSGTIVLQKRWFVFSAVFA
jgi:hypothetical protein